MDAIGGFGRARFASFGAVLGSLAVSRGVEFGRGIKVNPLAAHVAAMQGISPAGKYMLADPSHYAMSLAQAGVFTDAFGSPFTYTAPNVQASPTAVQDPASGLWYVSGDGVSKTALGSATETVAALTAVFRSPPGQATWSNYGGVLGSSNSFQAGALQSGGTTLYNNPYPTEVRRNGAALTPPYDLAPITSWMVITMRVNWPTNQPRIGQFFALAGGFFNRLDLAALRTWPTDPSAAIVQQTEAEMMRYFAPLIATNP